MIKLNIYDYNHFNFLFLHKFLLERKITYYAKLFAVLVAALSSVKYCPQPQSMFRLEY